MGYLTAICGAISSVFNYLTGRSNLNNTAEVQAAKKAQQEADAKKKLNDAIEKRDVKAIENEIAE